MLWSYWRIGPDGLKSPKRPRAYRYRDDARVTIYGEIPEPLWYEERC